MSSDPDRPTTGDERLATLAALVNGDVTLAYRLATELLAQGVPFDDIVVDVLSPVQRELGRRWAAGDLGVADEHAASAGSMTSWSGSARPPRPRVALQWWSHRRARCARARWSGGGECARGEGFRVLFLGVSVPADDLADFLDLQQPLGSP